MRILISAGPTREHIDPVRFLSNRSTGKMGFALAEAAVQLGHSTTLVAGPVSLPTPMGVRRIDVVSALDMLHALQDEIARADVLIMAAAVADWRPKKCASLKLKKSTMAPVIELEPNPDILKTLLPQKGEKIFIGFAAETGSPEEEAIRKLTTKGLDYICANDVSRPDSGFGVDTNLVTIYGHCGFKKELPLLSKHGVAKAILSVLA